MMILRHCFSFSKRRKITVIQHALKAEHLLTKVAFGGTKLQNVTVASEKMFIKIHVSCCLLRVKSPMTVRQIHERTLMLYIPQYGGERDKGRRELLNAAVYTFVALWCTGNYYSFSHENLWSLQVHSSDNVPQPRILMATTFKLQKYYLELCLLEIANNNKGDWNYD